MAFLLLLKIQVSGREKYERKNQSLMIVHYDAELESFG